MFRNFFGGSAPEEETENGAELVERFVERVETCSAPEDRIDALRALRSLAKKYRLAVGSMGLNAYVDILETERLNNNILTLVLDTLTAVLSGDDDSENDSDELGERLAELMLKKPTFTASVLSAIEHFDFGVRRTAIQLLTSLLRHRGSEVQSSVMKHPMGVTKLLDVIHDTREVVRNEAILMLCELSRSNGQIQQLLAYDNLFNLLFDVLDLEPLDSIVIEDCLFVMLNLLRKNAMNQQLFRENNLISRLGVALHTFVYGLEGEEDVATDANEWPKQRTANVIFLLQIVRTLVSPENSSTNVHVAQKIIYQTKILEDLCRILLSEIGASVEILTETVIVVAEVIRGNYTNQEYFASTSLTTEEQGDRSSLILLLISMTTEKQPFKLRCAVFYCFVSYVYDNEFGKTKIIETLLPQQQTENSINTGALICQAVTSAESVQVWFGCVALMHCLYQVEHLSEQLLRVQLTTSADEPTVSLLEHCTQLLTSMGNRRPQMRAGLLMLLSVWLNSSQQATEKFLERDEILLYLTTNIADEYGEGTESELETIRGLIAYLLLVCMNRSTGEQRQKLETMINRRVGSDLMVSALEGISRTEHFVRAAQKPQPLVKLSGELILDFYFIKMFKSNETSLVKQLKPNGEFNGTNNNDSIIQSFKDLIKRQDEEISVLKQENKKINHELQSLRESEETKKLEANVLELSKQLEDKLSVQQQADYYSAQLAESQRLTQQWYAEAERYKQWSQQWQQYQLAQLPNGGELGVNQLQHQVAELEQQLGYGYQAFEQQSQTMISVTAEIEALKKRCEKAEEQLTRVLAELEEAKSDKAQNGVGSSAQNGEEEKLQEDLLVLLAEQHNKINKYRNLLKSTGQEVTDDED